jgi:MerR family copper efflux transcriptional regulator
MLISEFSRRTGLSRDTVRFYVGLGLLKPKTSAKGGSNPYQLFSDEDVQLAEVIRISQALGMSLKEIGALSQARREGRASDEKSIEVLSKQAALMAQRARQFESMADYLRAKVAWLRNGKATAQPSFAVFMADDAAPAPRSPRPRAPISHSR